MKSFSQYLTEKLIVLNNGAKYGQIVIVLGGAGSGKGFAVSNFLESEKYKTLNIDDWNAAFLKMCKEKKTLPPELCNLSLTNAADVSKLHAAMKEKGIKDKILKQLFGTERNIELLPNFLFDITGKNFEDVTKITNLVKAVGYDPKNIHVVYVLTEWKTAYKRNLQRPRIVSGAVFLETHRGAVQTLQKIIDGGLSRNDVDGAINVILNNPENVEFHKGSSTVIKDFTYINLKRSGAEIKSGDVIMATVERWIRDNAPASVVTPQQ